jgi:hypothetical protein
MLSISDQGNGPFLPYYYQAGTQLDYPVEPQAHLVGLLHFPYQESARAYVPRSIPMTFDPTVMPDIDNWVRCHGSHLIFTYGSLDPYGATPFRVGPGSRDSAVYVLPGGDHLTLIALLPAAQQQQIIANLRHWAGLPSTSAVAALSVPSAAMMAALVPHGRGLFG